jgi:NAD(P)-dependent dehydrogenase (short-subunit alcohol dehydrogenase family)
VALVTGAGSGIGAACARRLSADGLRVVVTDVDLGAAEHVAADLPESQAVLLDVADSAAWRRAAEVVRSSYGRLDVVVNNAFTLVRRPAHETTDEEWDLQLSVDLSSVHRSVRTFHDELRQSGGCLVNVSSVHASFGVAGHPAYAAAKGGMLALTRQLAVEYGPDVRVNAVVPGPIRTPVWDRLSEPEVERSARATALLRLGRPEEVAAAVSFLADPAQSSFITGASLLVDGGWSCTKDSA